MSLVENIQVKAKVARGICILTSSLRPDVSNFLIVYPPKCKTAHWFPLYVLKVDELSYSLLSGFCLTSSFVSGASHVSSSCADWW